MPVAAATPTVLPLDSVKMDERKRPATDEPGSTPPSKRQAVSLNGSTSHADTDLPRNEDIDRYQKDAILRQMLEYKRERHTLERQIAAVNKRAEFHDDHIRQIDLWFQQLLDEVAILSNVSATELPSDLMSHVNFALLSSSNEQFSTYLEQHAQIIKRTLSQILINAPKSTPDVHALQERISALLVAEKAHIPEIERFKAEKEQLQDRLESATERYLIAEKKLDRARSSQVAKLEAQAHAPSRPEASGGKQDHETISEDGLGGAASETARKEAVAMAEKRKEQLEKMVTQNVKLTNDLTALQIKIAALGDEDYANSELFKAFKGQHEDVIRRFNDLDATTIQLREEVKLLHAERATYREEADNELSTATIDMQSEIAQLEADLARVKHKRDELTAEVGMARSAMEDHKVSMTQSRELAAAHELRIQALESEAQRIRGRESVVPSNHETSALDRESLQQKYLVAENEKISLENELRSMETAWKKASKLASKKIGDLIDAEERITKFSTEKQKADQKYFASMKLQESMKLENKTLRAQDMRTSEIISQLKEAESSCSSLLSNLEKQLTEWKDASANIERQARAAKQTIVEQKVMQDRQAKQVAELFKKVADKENSLQEAAKGQRAAEVELAEHKVKLEQSEKSLASWKKKKGTGVGSEESEMLRTMAQCNVCHSNWKDTALKLCGHVCCKECIDKQIQLRSRKCPLCGKVFGSNDYMHVTL